MPKLASWVLSHPHPTLCQAFNFSELQRQIQAPTLANPTRRSRWSGGGITHSWLGKRAASSQRVFCSFLLLICGHVWNLTLPCLFLCRFHTLLFLTNKIFPTRTNQQLASTGSHTWRAVSTSLFWEGCHSLRKKPTHPTQTEGESLAPDPTRLLSYGQSKHNPHRVDKERPSQKSLSGYTRFYYGENSWPLPSSLIMLFTKPMIMEHAAIQCLSR